MKANLTTLESGVIALYLGEHEYPCIGPAGLAAAKAFTRRTKRLAAKHRLRCWSFRAGELYLYPDSRRSINRLCDLLQEYNGRQFQARCINNWWR